MFIVILFTLYAGLWAAFKLGHADASGKKPTPCPPPGPDTLDCYRLLAQLRDDGGPQGVAILTEPYATQYPAEFLTHKVVVTVGVAGYVYSIEPR